MSAPAGGRVAAFFDIDGTLIEINSANRWLAHMRREGQVTTWQTIQSLIWLAQYRLSLLDFESVAARVTARYAGHRIDQLTEEVNRWYARDIRPAICRQSHEKVREHLDAGHATVILTSATRFLSRPLAAELGIEHILCTELDERDGVLTGHYRPPACYGPGKVTHAERFAAEHGIDLSRSYFYTDSYTDLPMLERVGEPRVINPDPRLRRWSVQRGWSFELWGA